DFARSAGASTPVVWSALSLSQLTEAGTIYSLDETAALAAIAHRCGARVHMDGSRFANAVVALDAAPADLSWRSGIDILSFGATKNGTMNADAVVVFDAALASETQSRLKKTGQLYSKMRFLAAQLLALLEGDLWLKNACHANLMAQRLQERLSAFHGVDVMHPVDGNHLLLRLAEPLARKLAETDSAPWQSGTDELGRPLYRLVTSFATEVGEIEQFAALLTASRGET